MADLSSLLPDAYERAVDSFLSEAVLALGLGKEVHDVGKLQAADSKARSAFDGRLVYRSPVGLVLTGVLHKDGAAPICTPTLTYEGWAVWLLRELVAVRAVEAIEKATEAEAAA